jgi:hypothetical protein
MKTILNQKPANIKKQTNETNKSTNKQATNEQTNSKQNKTAK